MLSLGLADVSRAAGTVRVTSTIDAVSADGLCTLREAILVANKDKALSSVPGECPAGSGADTIILPAGAYTLTRTDYGKDGHGNGRVYHIFFTATDGRGGSCSGEVKVGVVHDQGGSLDAIDGGPLYDSTRAH
ncbi:MAG TPA: CSLREA domain-containing protein [Anaerolineae bacterium]